MCVLPPQSADFTPDFTSKFTPGFSLKRPALPQVPAKYYPWALLIVWQLLMPGVSFLGHLSGVLVSVRDPSDGSIQLVGIIY